MKSVAAFCVVQWTKIHRIHWRGIFVLVEEAVRMQEVCVDAVVVWIADFAEVRRGEVSLMLQTQFGIVYVKIYQMV